MSAYSLADVYAPDDWTDSPHEGAVGRRYDHLHRCRRVCVGPALTIVFEDRQTLWFRMQELARVARCSPPGTVQKELEWYAGLLPGPDRLVAAVWVAEPGRRPGRALAMLRYAISAGRIGFRSDSGLEIIAQPRTGRVKDHLIGLAQWIEFPFTPEITEVFASRQREWHLFVEAEEYCHTSEPLSASVMASLLTDLASDALP
jgi:hypothetical protein